MELPFMPTPPTRRLAFSLPLGTFDLDRLHPELWEVDEAAGTAVVGLDGHWPRLLIGLSKTGLLMASVSAGPVSFAAALMPPRFEPIPDSAEWICLESGTQFCPANFGGALAVIERCGQQQMMSIQIFDRTGEGCLKLLATNLTDVAALEELVRRHACGRSRMYFGDRAAPPRVVERVPDAATVRSLWSGLRRTLPETFFPGMGEVTRQRALAVAGADHAWPVPSSAVSRLLEAMTLADAPMGGAVRNGAVFLPVGFYPNRWGHCECGVTFFSESVQLTLRRTLNQAQTWVTRFTQGSAEVLCLEIYDEHEQFCAGIGLRPEAARHHHQLWNEMLREYLEVTPA